MNKQQLNTMATRLNLMAARLNLKPATQHACRLVILDGLTGYAAEKQVWGRRTGTVMKACKRLRDELEYCKKVAK